MSVFNCTLLFQTLKGSEAFGEVLLNVNYTRLISTEYLIVYHKYLIKLVVERFAVYFPKQNVTVLNCFMITVYVDGF
jgi:hypothetical protein